MHPIVQKIQDVLTEASLPYEYMEHESGVSSEEMAKIRGDKYSLSEGTKALIVKTEQGFLQVIIPGDKKFSNAKLRRLLGVKEIRFASSEELSDITEGILPGAVPPFGNLFNLTVYADEGVFRNKQIVFNCGERTASIAMASSDYQQLVQPHIVDIAQ